MRCPLARLGGALLVPYVAGVSVFVAAVVLVL